MLSWALNAKDGETKGSAVNEASKNKLNILVRLLRNLASNIPPYLETMVCYIFELVEKVIIPCAIEMPVIALLCVGR